MTNEEAINYGKEQLEIFGGEHREFIEMAIKALETASCIKGKCAYCPHCERCDVDDDTLEIKALEQQPCEKCEVGNPCLYCEYDFTEKKTKESCEDAISREAVKEMLTAEWTKYMPMELDMNLSFVLDKISELPSVTPKARWIKLGKNMFINLENAREQYRVLGYPHRNELRLQCSECRMVTMVDESIAYNYCPHCGAKMEVEND